MVCRAADERKADARTIRAWQNSSAAPKRVKGGTKTLPVNATTRSGGSVSADPPAYCGSAVPPISSMNGEAGSFSELMSWPETLT